VLQNGELLKATPPALLTGHPLAFDHGAVESISAQIEVLVSPSAVRIVRILECTQEAAVGFQVALQRLLPGELVLDHGQSIRVSICHQAELLCIVSEETLGAYLRRIVDLLPESEAQVPGQAFDGRRGFELRS